MTLPPLTLDMHESGSEQRVTIRAKKYWQSLKDNLAFPSEMAINNDDIKEIWDNCFIVKANNETDPKNYKYKYIGKNLIDAYGQDLTDVNVGNIVSKQAERMVLDFEKVLATKSPVLDEAELKLENGQEIRYRQILLPLGENGVNITAILGGMSYKIYD